MFQKIAVAVFVFSLFGTGDAVISAWVGPVPSKTANANGTLSQTLLEDEAGSLNITFNATGATTYEIEKQTPPSVFTIDGTSGELSIATGQKLDYESAKSHILIVTAIENSNKGTATVTLSITDVNDFTPTFARAVYAVNIPDNSTTGTFVIKVTATDGDGSSTNQITSYSLTGPKKSDFFIDVNGTITVANTLHAKTTPKYALVVKAIDGGNPSLTGTTTVNVCVGCQSGEGVPIISLVLIVASVLFGIQQNYPDV